MELVAFKNYLYLCHNDNNFDLPVVYQLDNKAHTDYLIYQSVVDKHKLNKSIDQDRCKIGKIHGTVCKIALVHRKTVVPNIPCKDLRPA